MLTAKEIRGMYAIIPTPALPGSEKWNAETTLDLEETSRLINKLIADGISGLIALGTTGECATLRPDEYKKFAKCVISTTDNRVPCFIGATALGTHEVLMRLRFIEKEGASGSLLGLPMWQPVTTEMAVKYYGSVSEAFPNLAIMAYANSRAFRFSFDATFWGQVSRTAPTVTSAKFSNSAVLLDSLRATNNLINFVPIDSSVYEFYTLSQNTTTACWATAASMGPQPSIALIEAILNNDRDYAKSIANDIDWANEVVEDIIRDSELFASYNIQFEKARISSAGYCNPGPVRPPYDFIPGDMLNKCKENGRRWAEICSKYL